MRAASSDKNERCIMSQEEHILHELKEMHGWIAHADRQISRIKWSLWGIAAMLVLVIAMLAMK